MKNYRLEYLSALKEIIECAASEIDVKIIEADDGERDTIGLARNITDNLLNSVQHDLREFRKDVFDRPYSDFAKIHNVDSES